MESYSFKAQVIQSTKSTGTIDPNEISCQKEIKEISCPEEVTLGLQKQSGVKIFDKVEELKFSAVFGLNPHCLVMHWSFVCF